MQRLRFTFWNNLNEKAGDERGVSTTEYAIMLVLIGLAVATVGGSFGIDDAVVGVFNFVQDTLVS